MLLIPGAIIGLIALHLYLVIRLGVTLAAVVEEAAGDGRSPSRPGSRGARRARVRTATRGR